MRYLVAILFLLIGLSTQAQQRIVIENLAAVDSAWISGGNLFYRKNGNTFNAGSVGGTAPVTSVFGRTGVITAQSGDYSSFYFSLSDTSAKTWDWTTKITGKPTFVTAESDPLAFKLTDTSSKNWDWSRITAKPSLVLVGDTAGMLLPYLRKIDTTNKYIGIGWLPTLAAKQDALGFTPENLTNKTTGFGTLNNTLYPTTQAVANYVTGFNYVTRVEFLDSINNATKQQDTITLASFGAGSGAAGDTAAFSTSAIYGSFFNDGNDTLIITKMQIGLQGTSPNITLEVYYNDSLNVTAGAIKLVNAGNTATNTFTGTSVTTFNNAKIPPNVWVFVRSSVVAVKPTYLSLSLIGYKKRA